MPTFRAASMAIVLATSRLAAQTPAPQWNPAPAIFPRGAEIAVLSGDPTRPGRFTALLSMPDGYRMPPHYHPTDEYVEVEQGTFLVGLGDKLDPTRAHPMAVGDTGTAPAGVHHFAVAQGPTIVSISAMGPYGIVYVNPREDPQRTFPY